MGDPETASPVNPGDILAGKYRVDRVLGVGGMGVVVQALHLELDQRVAVKFLLQHAVHSPESVARFVREARAAVKIKSEHVARVIDVGRLETGAPYIVMEFLEGSDLGAVVQHGPSLLEDAVEYVLQACEAMADAHAAGIVHRDLKPSNLFLTQRSDGSPSIKVLDFGISKITQVGPPDVALTKTSALIGSPLYMSPEQLRSARTVDHRTDIWSLGVILFELLTGEPPFMAETLPQLIATILTEEPLSLLAKRPDLPAELARVVAKALEKDPEQRFRNVGELALALAPFAPRRSRYTTERILRVSGMDVPSSNEPVGTAATAPGATGPGTRTHDVWSGTRSGTRSGSPTARIALFAILGALGLGVVALLLLRQRAPEAPPAAATLEPVSVVPPATTAVPATSVSPPPAAPVALAPPVSPSPASPSPPPVVSVAPPSNAPEPPHPAAAPRVAAPTKRNASAARAPLPQDRGPSPALAPPAPAPAPLPGPVAAPTPKPAKNPLAIDLK